MSTEIKNTLYRFVTARLPKPVEPKEIKDYFVEHPEAVATGALDSFFLESVRINTTLSRKDLLAELSNTYPGFKTVKDAAPNSALVDFSIWLVRNRSTITREGIEDYFETVVEADSVSTADAIEYWDGLFYQILTSESPADRDNFISLLVADFLLNQIKIKPTFTSQDAKDWANARVIIPEQLFGVETISQTPNVAKSMRSTKALDNQLETFQVKTEISQKERLLGLVKKIDAMYQKLERKNYLAALAAFNEAVAAAYADADATEHRTVNPTTGEVRVYYTYENLELPTFSYVSTNPFDYATGHSLLNVEEQKIVRDLFLDFDYDGISEVIKHMEDELAQMNRALFEKASLSKKIVKAGGVIMPTSSGRLSNNAFSIKAQSKLGLQPVFLLFDNVAADVVVHEINNYEAKLYQNGDLQDTVEGTAFSQQRINGKLQVTIFPIGLDVVDRDTVEIKGYLGLSDNTILHFEGDAPISVPNANLSNLFIVSGNGRYNFEEVRAESEEGNPKTQTVIDYKPSGFGIKRLGIADYRKVEQEVCCYVPGEVSHIENVMAREYKEKSTRRLRRQEDTLTTSRERESEKLTDSTSTSRFEMNEEVNSVVAEQNSLAFGSAFSWGKPDGFSGSVHGDFAHNTSQETSDLQAVTHAQEVTERALERLVQKVKDERITKVVEEFEENNKHGFDNRKGDKHVSGVYRWVDKIFKNTIINYGKRLMYEFMIPEPAVFHNSALDYKEKNLDVELLIKPIDPRIGDGIVKLATPEDVTAGNYLHWASVYNVEVEPKPDGEIFYGKSFSIEKAQPDNESVSKNDVVKIPEGYEAASAQIKVSGHWDSDSGNLHSFSVIAGDVVVNGTQLTGLYSADEGFQTLSQYTGEIPVSMQFYNHHTGAVTVTVRATLTQEAYKKWQAETFNAIVSAYEDRLGEYNEKLAQEKVQVSQKLASNPLFYREIESTVLKKNCIEYMLGNVLGNSNLIKERDGGIDTLAVDYTSPNLERYAATAKFLEQAFEWSLMSYHFYPFFWANRDQWGELYNVEESQDGLFRAFLQSGMARVILTVRPGFEEAVNWFMATGQVWSGGQVPVLNDPLFISIVKELQEPTGKVEQTWESRVPTTLTVIQAGSIGLDVKGLPCDPDCKDYKVYDPETGLPVLDLEGNPVSTNPIVQSDAGEDLLGNVLEDLEQVTGDIEDIKTDIGEIMEDIEEIKDILNPPV